MKLLETIDDIILSEAIKSIEMIRKYEDYTKKPYVVEQVNAIVEKLKTLDNFIGTNRNGKRLYFTTDYEGKEPKNDDNEIFDSVHHLLDNLDYIVTKDSYKNGYAEDKSGRQIKIGKLITMFINKVKDDENHKEYLKKLLQAYNQDPIRLQGQMTKKKKLIVMSTANYDIAGMTQGRSWQQDSCMRLDSSYGQGGTYVHCDILFGTIVVFLINEDDKNIENPLGRTLVKPYINVQNGSDVYYAADPKEYGGQTGFNGLVGEMFKNLQEGKEGEFKLHHRLSNQGLGRIKLKKPVKIIDQSIINGLLEKSLDVGNSYIFIHGNMEFSDATSINKIELPNGVTFYLLDLMKVAVIDDVDCDRLIIKNPRRLTDLKNLYVTNRLSFDGCDSVKNVSGTILTGIEFDNTSISNINLTEAITPSVNFDKCTISSMPQFNPRLRNITFSRCMFQMNELPEIIGGGRITITFRGMDELLMPKIPQNKNYTIEIR